MPLNVRNPAGEQQGQRNDPTYNPSGPYGHGNGGLLSLPGSDPRIFGAMNMPLSGLLNALPVLRTPIDGGFGGYTNPEYTILTGVTAGREAITDQPTQPCTDGAAAGMLKLCTQVAPLGRFKFHVDEIDLETIGDLRDNADPTNWSIANPMNWGQGGGLGPPTPTSSAAGILRSEFTRRAWLSGLNCLRFLSARIYQGNPSNSSASNYWKDITGLDLQINENNKRDVYTSNLCKAANSTIMPFGLSSVTGTTRDIVKYLNTLFRQLQWNATRQGLTPVTWKIAMRPELFEEILMVWPVRQYQEALAQIAQFTGARLDVIGADTLRMRDDLRANSHLPILGQMVEVIQDEFITETTPNQNATLRSGQYASDIYVIPFTVMGGLPSTYLQPYNMANGIAEEAVRDGQILDTFTTDGGLFRWYVKSKNGCIGWDYSLRFRLLSHCTQLAGRITNVMYEPLMHFRSSDPASDYFADGGRTQGGNLQKYYTEWSGGSTPVIL